MTLVLPPWIGTLYGVLAIAAALWKGDGELRATAVVMALNLIISPMLVDHSWPPVQWGEFAIDGAVFVFFLALALRSARYWPLAACGFQLLLVLTHLAKLVDPNVQQWAYLSALIVWCYLVMTAFAVGTWNSWRASRPAVRGAERSFA